MPYKSHTKILFLGLLPISIIGLLLWLNLWDLWALKPGMCHHILQHIYLPRLLIAFLSGAGLAICGTALQSITLNPLAEPSLLGVSSLSVLGVVLALFLKASHTSLLFSAAIFMALIAPLSLLYCLNKGRHLSHILLIGISLSLFAMAFTSLLLNMFDNPYAQFQIMFWLMGSFAHTTWENIAWLLPFFLLGCTLLFRQGLFYDRAAFGLTGAEALGSAPRINLFILVVGVSLIVAPLTALTGTIGFIGLIVPHIMRSLITSKPSQLLIPSFLGGGAFAIMVDQLIQLIPSNMELNVGVITALIGVPIFIHILLSHDKYHP